MTMGRTGMLPIVFACNSPIRVVLAYADENVRDRNLMRIVITVNVRPCST